MLINHSIRIAKLGHWRQRLGLTDAWCHTLLVEPLVPGITGKPFRTKWVRAAQLAQLQGTHGSRRRNLERFVKTSSRRLSWRWEARTCIVSVCACQAGAVWRHARGLRYQCRGLHLKFEKYTTPLPAMSAPPPYSCTVVRTLNPASMPGVTSSVTPAGVLDRRNQPKDFAGVSRAAEA